MYCKIAPQSARVVSSRPERRTEAFPPYERNTVARKSFIQLIEQRLANGSLDVHSLTSWCRMKSVLPDSKSAAIYI